MLWIELNNVEYGECIVLGGRDRSILMVDCGSMNQKVRDGDTPLDVRFESIAERYEDAMDRFFLLTHYHRDHLCGLKKLLDSREGYFSRVFLPSMPLDSHGIPLLLDFAMFAYLFLPPQTDCCQVNTSCIRIFRMLGEKLGPDRIFTLRAGDLFHFDGVDYKVLWPRVEEFPFEAEVASAVEEMNILFSSPFLPECEQRFLALKNDFLSLYVKCCEAFSVSGRALPEKRRQYLAGLDETLREIEGLKAELNLCPNAHDVREILERPISATSYSDCINAASVVFHNVRAREASFDDILMTGDVTPEVLESLQDELYDGYNVLKAPHHGTASGYCRLFSEMSAAHILISNGEYHAGGSVAQEYIDLQDSVRHCTNHNACKWFQTSQACCNRLSYCYDQEPGAGLVIKCPAATGRRAEPGCQIRTVGPSGEHACICEDSGRPY